jgi:prolyl oligopeptidase family protein
MAQRILLPGPGFVDCSALGEGRTYYVAGSAPNTGIAIEAGTSTANGPAAIVGNLKAPERFKVGVASSPVTDARLYDSGYQERYMGTPEKHPKAYDLGLRGLRQPGHGAALGLDEIAKLPFVDATRVAGHVIMRP